MKYLPATIWSLPGSVPFDFAFEHTDHRGRFLRGNLSLRGFHNSGRLVRDETGGSSNRRRDRPASHFHSPGIRGFGKQQRSLGKLKRSCLRIE